MKKIAIILGGCGSKDGSEIQETISLLIALSQRGLSYQCFAPNRNQVDVINHLTGEAIDESRNLMVEAGRLARGEVKALALLNPSEFDALIIPGGFGVAKNFSDFPTKGSQMSLDGELAKIILEFNQLQKYIGAICISPVLVAKAFANSGKNVLVTTGIGNGVAADCVVKNHGQVAEILSSEICVDEKNRIVTTPAYMNDCQLKDVFAGIDKLVDFIAQA